ncbi:MAG: FtsX-like permease family protein [Ferruginibacter sp.]
MFKNYFNIAVRVLWRNKVYVFINLMGLGFALACCILSYLNYEYRADFDKNHLHTENIYRLNNVRAIEGSTQRWGITPVAIGEYLSKDLQGSGRIARIFSNNVVIKNKENVFDEQVHYADANIFSFFDLPLQKGNYSQFDKINTIIISQPVAEKYFGKEEPVGKELTMVKDGKEDIFTVIGVLKKIPLNSSFQVDIITDFKNGFAKGDLATGDWKNKQFVTTFAEITNPSMVKQVEKQITAYAPIYNKSSNDWKISNFYFQPFKEVALSSDVDFDEFVHGRALNANPRGVMVFTPIILSLFILLIACFNFTNISIAFASKRLKEIGVRKVMGVRRRQLIVQFLGENILLCLVASLLAMVLVYSMLPFFNSWSGVGLQLNFGTNIKLWMILLLLPVFTAIVAGLYPSFYISSFEPVSILKGVSTFGPKSRFTKALLLAQFSISCIALVIGISLTKNASFQDEVDFGYAINEVAVTRISNSHEFTALSNALRNDPRIEKVAGTVNQLGAGSRESKIRCDKDEINVQVAEVGGQNYLDAMGIKLISGRHFYAGEGLDKEVSVIVNQTLVNKLNLQDPIGKQIELDSNRYSIVGVVKDYKEFGLHGMVPACVLKLAVADNYKYLVVRATPKNLAEAAKATRATWYKVAPGKPYNGFLQSDVIDKEKYMNAGFKSVSFFLATVILLLSASGLFALVSLNILRRKQEIGVRKVLGASIANLMKLVSKDFIYIVLIAFAIGSALGYLLIDKIIFNFIYVYHAPIGIEAFVGTLFILLFFCSLTVGLKVFRAANANPIRSLRTTP